MGMISSGGPSFNWHQFNQPEDEEENPSKTTDGTESVVAANTPASKACPNASHSTEMLFVKDGIQHLPKTSKEEPKKDENPDNNVSTKKNDSETSVINEDVEENLDIVEEKTLVEKEIQRLADSIEAELQKGENLDFPTLERLVREYLRWQYRQMGRFDKEYTLKVQEPIELKVQEIKKSYNTGWQLAVTIISAACTIGGGFLNLGPAFKLAKDTVKSLSGVSKLVSGIGTATSSQGLGALINNKYESTRILLNFDFEDLKRKRDNRNQSHGENQGRVDQTGRDVRETESKKHDTIANLVRQS